MRNLIIVQRVGVRIWALWGLRAAFCLGIIAHTHPVIHAQSSTNNFRIVAANGNDSNDGLTIANAKLTIYGALTDLVNSGTAGSQGGMVYLYQNNSDSGAVKAAPTSLVFSNSHSGVWIMADGDPNNISVSTLTRVDMTNTVTMTAAETIPTISVFYQTGRTVCMFGAGDTSFNGCFAIASVSSTQITWTQAGADATSTAGKGRVVPNGWVPQYDRPVSIISMSGTSSGGSGQTAPLTLIDGGQQDNVATITSISESGNTVTAVLSGGTWRVGAPIVISDVPTAGYNGYFIIASVSGTTITYNNPTGSLGSDSSGNALQALPTLWLSGINGFTMSGVSMSGPLPALLNLDSNMSLTTSPAMLDIHISRSAFSSNCGNALCGPTMWIGGNFLWGYYDNIYWQANPLAAATSDRRSAVLMKNTGASGSAGLMHFFHNNSAGGGGVRWYGQNQSSMVYIDGWLLNGTTQNQPVFEVMNNGSLAAEVKNVGTSSTTDRPPLVRVPANFAAGASSVSVCNPIGSGGEMRTEGPMTICNVDGSNQTNSGGYTGSGPNTGHQAQGRQGFTSGRLVNLDSNMTRRNNPPVRLQFANVATQASGSWTTEEGTSVTVTGSQADPFGGTDAAKLTCTANGASGYCAVRAYSASHAWQRGEYFVAEVWAKPADHSVGPNADSGAIRITGSPTIGTYYKSNAVIADGTRASPLVQGDGQWQRVFVWGKTTASGTATTRMLLVFDPTHPMIYYAPGLYFIQGNQVAQPSAPSVSQSGGGALPATTYYAKVTYVNDIGETEGSSATTFAASANNFITVTSPGASTGATGWNVYVGNATMCPSVATGGLDLNPGQRCLIKQNSSPINIGTDWTQSGALTTYSSWYIGKLGSAGQTLSPGDTTNTYGDAEVADWALSVSGSSSSCTVGQLCDMQGAVPHTADLRSIHSTAVQSALTSTWTASNLTLDKAITVTRMQVQAKTAPSGCSPNAVVRLSDGTTTQDVTISAAANDSGAITKNYPAGAALTVSVQTAASGCGTAPADANVIVQYRIQ